MKEEKTVYQKFYKWLSSPLNIVKVGKLWYPMMGEHDNDEIGSALFGWWFENEYKEDN